ncbi:MAG: glycosyltransferase [bacterium]
MAIDKNIPQVSVIMPAYNGERYIKSAIDSILSQTFSDFEFIIIDDGSKDHTATIINSFSDHRIRLLTHKHNLGIVSSLNAGIKIAKAPFIARMDADDISVPNRLKIQYEYLCKHKDVDVCGGNLVTIDNLGKIISRPWWAKDGLPISWQLLWQNVIPHPTVMIRASNLPGIVYRERFLSEDYDLWLRMMLGGGVVRLEEVLLYYRLHDPNSKSALDSRTSMEVAYKSNIDWILSNLHLHPPIEHRWLSGFSAYGEDFGALRVRNAIKWIDSLISRYLALELITTDQAALVTKWVGRSIAQSSEKLRLTDKIRLVKGSLIEGYVVIAIQIMLQTIKQYVKITLKN